MSTFHQQTDAENNHSPEHFAKSEEYGCLLEAKHSHDEKRLTQFLEFESKLSASQRRLNARERYLLFLEKHEYSLNPQERGLLLLGRQAGAGQN
ncbi:MAG: hypothetical protein F4X65_03005 [Chloroflexi bacterium]|nr:hypothetical protein [Chloroflexota bacterium]